MELTYKNGQYYISCEHKERDAVRELGFRWSSDEKRWYTPNWWIALKSPAAAKDAVLAPRLKAIMRSYKKRATYLNFDKLLDYQVAGVEEMCTRKNVLLADEQGLGKTAQAITYCNLVEKTRSNKILVICPASLKLNWIREFIKFGTPGGYHIKIMSHGKDRIKTDKSILTGKKCNVVIVNYDLLKSRIILDQLKAWEPNIVIADEAHYLKNSRTARTKNFIALTNPEQKIIAISGTPILNRPIELFPILKAISPETIEPFSDYRRYANRFCGAYYGRWGLDVSGATNLEELSDRLRATCMIRRLKEEVAPQLPHKTLSILPFEQNKVTGKVIEKEYRFDIESLKERPEKGQFGELAEIRQELALAKLPESISAIKDLLQNVEKVVVFAWHRSVLKGLMDGLADYAPVLVAGGILPEVKQKAIDDFQKGNARVFIGQIQSAGVGITLTAANNIEFVETTWSPGEIDQAIDRCHRIGQNHNVSVRFHVVEKSLDETMLAAILKKKKTINQILK